MARPTQNLKSYCADNMKKSKKMWKCIENVNMKNICNPFNFNNVMHIWGKQDIWWEKAWLIIYTHTLLIIYLYILYIFDVAFKNSNEAVLLTLQQMNALNMKQRVGFEGSVDCDLFIDW